MSKRSRGVWRIARENVGLPKCPQELSEPEYANLVFITECQVGALLVAWLSINVISKKKTDMWSPEHPECRLSFEAKTLPILLRHEVSKPVLVLLLLG